MKVTLFALNGSFSHTNLAIRRLRPPLEAAGFDVFLLEAGLRDGDASILEQLMSADSQIYGFSCYIWNISRMLLLAENLKSLRPDSLIIFGGPEVSFDVERFDDCHFIDCIIRGSGEIAITDICNAYRDGKRPPHLTDGGNNELSEGILYRADELAKKTLYYESTVGCPFSCAFCLSSATGGVASKSAEQTLDELFEFEQISGNFIIKFVDRTFNYDIIRANNIWRGLLNPKYTKRYQFEICTTLLNNESYDILSQFPGGRIQLEAGLQSTNAKTLSAVARHLDPQKTLDACDRLMKLGNLHLHLDLIAGLPFEDYTTFAKSFNDAYYRCHQLQLGFLKLLHGTALRRDAEKYGYKFTAEPPYTVLMNNSISFAQIRRLSEIADLIERYRNSGKFDDSLSYAVGFAPSPFAFFEGILDFIASCDGRNIRKIGQNETYSLLFRYASKLPGINTNELDLRIHSDYARFEVRRAPKFDNSDISD